MYDGTSSLVFYARYHQLTADLPYGSRFRITLQPVFRPIFSLQDVSSFPAVGGQTIECRGPKFVRTYMKLYRLHGYSTRAREIYFFRSRTFRSRPHLLLLHMGYVGFCVIFYLSYLSYFLLSLAGGALDPMIVILFQISKSHCFLSPHSFFFFFLIQCMLLLLF